MKKWTHDNLVDRAAKWLRSMNCSVVLEEMTAYTWNGETPDAIGWVENKSILIECKTSRADFRKDLKKRFRDPLYKGMGQWRFYLTPEGLLKENDCPVGWGIYEIKGRSVIHAYGSSYASGGLSPFVPCHLSEKAMLLSAIRRLQINEKSQRKETEMAEQIPGEGKEG